MVTWLAPDPTLTLTGASVTGTLVTVEVTGSASPPSTTSLAQALTAVLGPGAAVRVNWFQTNTAAASHTTGSAPLTLAQLQPLVQSWLAKTPDGASSMRIVQLASSGDAVSVELAGPSAPPPASALAQAISKRAGRTVTVSVSWQTVAAQAPSPPSGAQQAQTVVATWLSSHPGLDLLDVSLADGIATIDLAGTQPSQVTADLRTALEAKLGPDVTIVIRFTRLTVPTPAPAGSAGSG